CRGLDERRRSPAALRWTDLPRLAFPALLGIREEAPPLTSRPRISMPKVCRWPAHFSTPFRELVKSAALASRGRVRWCSITGGHIPATGKNRMFVEEAKPTAWSTAAYLSDEGSRVDAILPLKVLFIDDDDTAESFGDAVPSMGYNAVISKGQI